MNLNQLYYFKTLAFYEHYTKASEILHISQPSLSKAINLLETELNTILFEKQGRNIRLTKQGKIYNEFISKALHEIEKGNEYLRKGAIDEMIQINMGAISSIVLDFLPELFTSYQLESNKKIFFTVKNDVSQGLVNLLKSGDLDVILCTNLQNDPDIEYIPIIKQEFVVALPQNHPLSSSKSLCLEEIKEENFIIHSPDSIMHRIVLGILDEHNIIPRVVSEASEDCSILSLVKANYGISILTESANTKNIDGVAFIPINHIDYERYVSLGYLRNTLLPPTIQAFIQYIREHYTYSSKL